MYWLTSLEVPKELEDINAAAGGEINMKEIRQVYVAQKKKGLRNHFAMVGAATALLGALAAAVDQLLQMKKES